MSFSRQTFALFVILGFIAPCLGWSLALPKEFSALNQFGNAIQPDDFAPWQVKKGGTLRFSIDFNYDLILPGWHKDRQQVHALPYNEALIFEPLMWSRALGASETVFSGVVRSVTYLADEHAFVLHVQDNVTFSDGSPVSANDVVWSFEYAREHFWAGTTVGQQQNRMFGEGFVVRALNTQDVYVQFQLNSETELRRALFQFVTDTMVFKLNPTTDPLIQIPNEYLGTGPFVVAKATREQFTLKHRSNYWYPESNVGNFDQMDVFVIREMATGREAFTAGLTNYWPELTVAGEHYLETRQAQKNWQHYVLPLNPVSPLRALQMNMAHGHMRDRRFRQAMMLALDDETMNRNFRDFDDNHFSRIHALGTSGEFKTTGLPRPEVAALLAGDPNEAEALRPFEEMGMLRGTEDQTRLGHLRMAHDMLAQMGYLQVGTELQFNGRPVELEVLMGSGPALRYVQTFEENLRMLGIKLKYNLAHDDSSMLAGLQSGAYDFYNGKLYLARDLSHVDVTYFSAMFGSAAAVVNDKTGWNRSNWQSPAVDKIANELAYTPQESPRYKVLIEAFVRLFSANVPLIFLGENPSRAFFTDTHFCLPPKMDWSPLYRAYYDAESKCAQPGPAY